MGADYSFFVLAGRQSEVAPPSDGRLPAARLLGGGGGGDELA